MDGRAGCNGGRSWTDPRSVLAPEAREALGREPGLTRLFERLDAIGPRRIPTREAAADIVGTSVSTFRRLFARATGMQWREFCLLWRVDSGEQYLAIHPGDKKGATLRGGYAQVRCFMRARRTRDAMAAGTLARSTVSKGDASGPGGLR
jgi:methylphosphotriester-DNA--protein-cysteine methyltransferase